MEELKLKTVENLITWLGNEVINEYREQLTLNNSNCTGLLGNSLRTSTSFENGKYDLYLWLQDYWKYVEYGRKAGKFPNLDAIKRWIKNKPVLPMAYNGKLPTMDTLAYLIGRKIERYGTSPTNALNTTMTNIEQKFSTLDDAIDTDLKDNVDLIFENF